VLVHLIDETARHADHLDLLLDVVRARSMPAPPTGGGPSRR
jgi:hypothetical protein